MRTYLLLSMLALLSLMSCDMSATREEADQLMKDGEYEAAAAAYDRVIKLSPDDNYSLFNRANANEKLENFDKAYDDYSRLIQVRWNSRKALLGRARCSFELENFKGVVMDMNALLSGDPENIEGRSLRGRSFVKLGEVNNAIDDLSKVLDKKPRDTKVLVSRGAAWARGGDGVMAIRDFNRALDVDNNLPVAHFNKGVVFFVYENWDAAIESFDIALKQNPEYAEAFTRRGMAKIQSSSFSIGQACSDFEKGDDLDDELATEYIKEYCK